MAHKVKIEIDWDKLSNWVEYIAMDADGQVGLYESEPKPGKNMWIANEAKYQDSDVIFFDDWKDSLQKRPEK